MFILAIDPGLAITGYAVLEMQAAGRVRARHYGAVITEAGLPLPQRLLMIYNQLTEVIDMFQPAEAALEELFFNKNVTTALTVGQARGVALLALARRGLPVYEYTPLQVKQAVVGHGRASKSQVQYMVRMLLALPEVPRPDDVADALAVGLCHAFRLQNRGVWPG
ncbi:crossover junction endodeoxyribonuclease RuvC [Desulfurispora thermophila]|uniref:crossover junction endodeoxyribonuclease RuvC n=1 Tax=Desulfurispora thermophila TaxID=265470 RepID=UPI0003823641|nr:crossover junction endodeoxyribonuclease RuvC [Desulfurispora thermophila]